MAGIKLWKYVDKTIQYFFVKRIAIGTSNLDIEIQSYDVTNANWNEVRFYELNRS